MSPIVTARRRWFPVASIAGLVIVAATGADEPPALKESPLVKMLRSGRVPEGRQGTIIDMIGKRGNAADLGFLFERVLSPEGVSSPTRLKALEALAEAALTRGVRPPGDLGRLAAWIEPKAGAAKVDPAARHAAVRLAGLWKAPALGDALRAVAEDKGTDDALRGAALESLAAVGGPAGRASIEGLTKAGEPSNVRAQAVAALARIDVDAAAARAVAVLRDAGKDENQDFAPMLAPFLNRQGGADKLAAAVARETVPADAAKLALRAVYALGRSDAGLVAALTKAAGIDAEVKPLDKAAMDRMIADVAAKGDPARGEKLFRRADLNCAKCHALSGAGGGVGPDLSAVGVSSPVDYLVNSIMLPDQAIKEEFHTLIVQTADGQVFHGIVADRDANRVVLKEATGEPRTVPAADIEESKEGGSLMPKGLANFLTRAEFVDLVRFLSELGKPGPYAVRSTPTVQRWRFLKPVNDELARAVPSDDSFRTFVLDAEPAHWLPAYAMTGGDLPLDELTAAAGSKVLYLQAEVAVSQGDRVTVALNSAEGVRAWVDDHPAPEGASFDAPLSPGRHSLTFRVDTAARKARALRVEVLKPSGSTAEYTVVGGR